MIISNKTFDDTNIIYHIEFDFFGHLVFITFGDAKKHIYMDGKSFFILNNKVSWTKDYNQTPETHISPQCQKYIEKIIEWKVFI